MAKNKKTKMLRIKFLPEKRGKFFKNLTESSHYSEKELAKLVGINRRSYYDWKKGRSNPPLKTVRFFCKKFRIILPEKEEVLIERWQKEKCKSAKTGGRARFEKYGSPGTKKGRSKGGKETLRKLREKGIIPGKKKFFKPKYSARLAEFIGIVLGDGTLSKDQVKVYLNSKKDREYSNFVISLANSLFKAKFRKIERKNYHVLVVYDSGVNLVEFLLSIGLKRGNKVKNQVAVPKWIRKNSFFSRACLRGLMDTDGGIFIHQYHVNKKKYSYLKLCFTNRSLPLLKFVYKQLLKEGFNPKLAIKLENKKVWLYNNSEVLEYLKIIGTHNSRLKESCAEWLRHRSAKPGPRKGSVGSSPTLSA